MSKKKICFIAQFPPPIHGLSKAVDTLYNSDLAEKFEFEKVDITNNKKFLSNIIKIWKSKADLFYFTISQTKGGNLRDLIILKLLEKQGKKCLVHLHGGYYRQLIDKDLPKWQSRLNYRAVSKLAGVIVLGPSLRYIFQGMLTDERIYTVPNCVDDEYLMSDQEFENKIATIKDRDIKHVLYLSNFIKSKGYPEVLKMAKYEKERVERGGKRKFHFDFAGKFFDKSEETFFWNYVKDNHIDEYITFHGIVSGDKKRELLKKCDIFVLLTRYPKEGQPISILEAMGNGMVIVTTDYAGISDQVQDKVTGCVVSKDRIDVKEIYNYILEINNYSTIDRNGVNIVNNQFSQSKYISNMEKQFLKLL